MDEKLTRDRFNFASKKLREMREKKILTDVTLKCRGGTIYAHRCVLMATNQFFFDMFSKNLDGGDTELELEFPDVSVQVLSTVISTLYGDVPQQIKNDSTQIIKVLEASHLIQERLLSKYCLELLMDHLSVDNCADVWNVTTKYREENEEYQVMGFMLNHLSELITQNKLVDASIDQMCDFVSYASGILDNGDQLLLIVIAWGKKNQAERIEKVVTLINILEKLKFSNYSALRFELEYFAQNSLRLKKRLEPLMNRLLPRMINKRLSVSRSVSKTKILKHNISSPTPLRIAPPPSSVASSSLISSSVSTVQIIPPPPSSVSSFTSRRSTPTSIKTSNEIKPVSYSSHLLITSPLSKIYDSINASFQNYTEAPAPTILSAPLQLRYNIQIHIFHLFPTNITKMAVATYSIFKNVWRLMEEVPLPNFISKSWYPLVSSKNKRFYFGITSTKTFVAFSESSGEIFFGPSVSFRSRLTGVSDGILMYVWNYECIGQFNSELKEWRTISPNLHIVSNCSNLLAMNGNLYIHAVFPPILYQYDFDRELWVVKKVFPEKSALKSIKCKCCHLEECKGQLYFYTNENLLVIYDVINDLCRSVLLDVLESGLPLLMSCDQGFIIFVDKIKSDSFLYLPDTNEIKYFEKCKSQLENLNMLTCDISVL